MSKIFPNIPRARCILFTLDKDCDQHHENGFFVLKVVANEIDQETLRVLNEIKLLYERKFSVLMPCITTMNDIIVRMVEKKPCGKREVDILIDIIRKEKRIKEQELEQLGKEMNELTNQNIILKDALIRYKECEVLWWFRLLPFYCI